MIGQLNLIYPNCAKNNCHVIFTNELTKIIETHASHCVIDNSSVDENFLIKNPNNKVINFIAIDKCIFLDDALHKKCDFAVFDDKIFALIEIKDTNNRKTRAKHTKKAYKQLSAILSEFEQKSVSFNGFSIEAIIAFKYRPLRPLINSASMAMRVYFKNRYKASLMLGNEKEFL